MKFKESKTITGKIKGVTIQNGKFVDYETGEVIDVVGAFESIYGDSVFDISTTLKTESDLEISESGGDE